MHVHRLLYQQSVYLESSLMSTLTACLFSPVTPWHGGPPITMSMSPVHHPRDSGLALVEHADSCSHAVMQTQQLSTEDKQPNHTLIDPQHNQRRIESDALAARYDTWLLIELMPKGVVLSFLCFSRVRPTNVPPYVCKFWVPKSSCSSKSPPLC